MRALNRKKRGVEVEESFTRAAKERRAKAFVFTLCFSLFFASVSPLLVAEMGTGASRLVGGGAQGASLADKGGAAGGDAAAAGAHDASMADADDKTRLPTTTTSAALSEEDRASAAAAAAVACAFGLENFGNTCYCNSVLQVR